MDGSGSKAVVVGLTLTVLVLVAAHVRGALWHRLLLMAVFTAAAYVALMTLRAVVRDWWFWRQTARSYRPRRKR
ncbi:MAG TPA: hypothetical protein VMU09_11195 [Acidimicrobiales bacterium]|nr:hypothetical protein [Acidimicrobiales bacterium]